MGFGSFVGFAIFLVFTVVIGTLFICVCACVYLTTRQHGMDGWMDPVEKVGRVSAIYVRLRAHCIYGMYYTMKNTCRRHKDDDIDL